MQEKYAAVGRNLRLYFASKKRFYNFRGGDNNILPFGYKCVSTNRGS